MVEKLWVCLRVDEEPNPPTLPTEGPPVRDKCADCGAEVWRTAFAAPDIKRICGHCGETRMKAILGSGQGLAVMKGSEYVRGTQKYPQ